MSGLRIAFAITTLLGAIYAAAGIFTSLGDFALGVVVASCGLIGLGAVDYAQARRDEDLYLERTAVWERRDNE